MKNFVQPGVNLTLAAPYARASGEAAMIGSIFGVASNDVAVGVDCAFVTEGVFDLAKAPSQAWTVGLKVYWDATNKYLTSTASGNTLVGVAVTAVGSGAGETTGRVKLGIVG